MNQAAEDTKALYQLSYVPRGDPGRRGSNPQPPALKAKEPPSAQQADSILKVHDNRRDIVDVGCEARVRTRTSWVRARRGSSSTTSHRFGLDGRARTSNPRLPKPVRSRCATSRWGWEKVGPLPAGRGGHLSPEY